MQTQKTKEDIYDPIFEKIKNYTGINEWHSNPEWNFFISDNRRISYGRFNEKILNKLKPINLETLQSASPEPKWIAKGFNRLDIHAIIHLGVKIVSYFTNDVDSETFPLIFQLINDNYLALAPYQPYHSNSPNPWNDKRYEYNNFPYFPEHSVRELLEETEK